MKVCVFGANGYVGSSVYKKLKNKHALGVVGTYLDEPATFHDLHELDINEPESFSSFYKKENPDVVVWAVMDGPNENRLIDQGLIHLITHLTPQTKLVYISSDFVFAGGEGPYVEEDPISRLPDDHLNSNYTNAKVKAEYFVDNELSNYVILRAGPIYGENQLGISDEQTDKLAYHLKIEKTIPFRDDLIRTFVHVEDLATVITEMAVNDVIGVYHVGPNKKQSYFEMMRSMTEQLGYDPDLVKKESEYEKPDHGIPKNTSLITEKITEITELKFR